MFVRVKNIKGRPYAYLVENEWTPWGSRQKVAKYLGKTHLLTRISEGMLELPEGLQQTILQGVVQELQNHGFTKEGDLMVKEDVIVSLQEQTIRQKNKKVVLGMNEGYLCDHTLQQALAFVPEERPDKSAKKLANLILEAGLKLSNEQFLHLFEQAGKK